METIKIANIKNEAIKLNALIEEYESNILNLYNEVNKSEDYWKDGNATLFYKEVKLNKIKVDNTIDELKEMKKIYKYMYVKYGDLGNKVEFDLNYKSKVMNELNEYILSVSSIINEYESLDLSFCPYEAKYIKNELAEFKELKNNLIDYKEELKNKYEYIDEIEKKIKNRISKIDIATIQEIDISEYI